MSLDNGLLHLANWAGNVVLPTLAALLIAMAIVQFSKGQESSHALYGAVSCLLISGFTRALESFASQRAWDDPDQYWVALLTLMNWVCNVILPAYASVQVVVAAISLGSDHHFQPTSKWMRHFLSAGMCLMVSGLLRLAEFLVANGGPMVK